MNGRHIKLFHLVKNCLGISLSFLLPPSSYGWANPSYNASGSKNSNIPLSYNIVPNEVELDQLVIRVERQPDTVQTDHVD